MGRSTRKQPFCWQEKKVLRLIRKKFKKKMLVKMRCLYLTITEIDNDFNGKEIKYYTKTISTYSGLPKDWIPTGLRELEKLGVIKIVEERENGKRRGKNLIFTPENVALEGQKANTGKANIRKPNIRKACISISGTSEESTYIEEIKEKEENKRKEERVSNNTMYSNTLREVNDSFSLPLMNEKEFNRKRNEQMKALGIPF